MVLQIDSPARALCVFAKAPRPGHVKTRLVPLLGERRAAELAAAFVRDTMAGMVRIARDVNAVPYLFYDPPSAGPAMRALVTGDVAMHPQHPGDLSRRLEAARRRLHADGYVHLCFVGADSPTLPLTYVERAFTELHGGTDVAIGPASDGGYYLIALPAARAGLFERIDWSTERVFAQTVARIVELRLSHAVLPEWYDVDDAASLRRLREELLAAAFPSARGASAPRSQALLACMNDVAW